MSNIGQAWANLNDSDDENDDDDKTMIETGKSDASLAYMALLTRKSGGLSNKFFEKVTQTNVPTSLIFLVAVLLFLYRQ